MSSEDLYAKLCAFLSGQFSRKEGRQCVRLDLLYAQAGFRDEELRSWHRDENAEIFESLTEVENLCRQIIEIAEGHADSFGQGAHRYQLRTHQHLGGRETLSFKMAPSSSAGSTPGEELALATGKESRGALGEAMGIVTQNNMALMRSNQQMFQSSFGTLAGLTEHLRKENTELRNENQQLRRRVDDAESTRTDRDYQIAMQMEKSKLKSKGIEQLLQFGTIAMAKLTGGAPGKEAGTPLGRLVFQFGDSLQPSQIQTMIGMLTPAQQAMFMEIMGMVAPREEEQQQQPPKQSNGANGASHA